MRVWPQPCRAAVPCVSRCFSAGCLFIRCQCLIVFMFNSVELQPCLALSRALPHCLRQLRAAERKFSSSADRADRSPRHCATSACRPEQAKESVCAGRSALCVCMRVRACARMHGRSGFLQPHRPRRRIGRVWVCPFPAAPRAPCGQPEKAGAGPPQDGSFARGSAIVWASGASVRGWRPGSSWRLRGQWECWQQLIHRFGRAVWMGGIVVLTDVRH